MKGFAVGSTGAFLETGGFSEQGWEDTGKKMYGIKVLEKVNKSERSSLPPRSNTPGTAYILLDEKGKFNIIRQYGEDRKPLFDIEYGEHKHVLSLHIHRFDNNSLRQSEPDVIAYGRNHIIDEKLYNKYKKFLKGISL